LVVAAEVRNLVQVLILVVQVEVLHMVPVPPVQEHQDKEILEELVHQVLHDGLAVVAVVQARPAEMQQVPQVVLVVMVSHLQLQVLL
jgi:hypothetical protein